MKRHAKTIAPRSLMFVLEMSTFEYRDGSGILKRGVLWEVDWPHVKNFEHLGGKQRFFLSSQLI